MIKLVVMIFREYSNVTLITLYCIEIILVLFHMFEEPLQVLGVELVPGVPVGLHPAEHRGEALDPVLVITGEVLHGVRQGAALAVIQVLAGTPQLLPVLAELPSRSVEICPLESSYSSFLFVQRIFDLKQLSLP